MSLLDRLTTASDFLNDAARSADWLTRDDARLDDVTDGGLYCGACDGGPGAHRPDAHPAPRMSPFERRRLARQLPVNDITGTVPSTR